MSGIEESDALKLSSSPVKAPDPILNEDLRAQDDILDEEYIYRKTHPELEHKKPTISCFHG